MEYINQYIEENKERFLEELFELIRIPSISSIAEHKPVGPVIEGETATLPGQHAGLAGHNVHARSHHDVHPARQCHVTGM